MKVAFVDAGEFSVGDLEDQAGYAAIFVSIEGYVRVVCLPDCCYHLWIFDAQ
ncbi:MAG TPA: hypothetical protein VGK04_11220 [Thermoanaerobaculia bacterium]|jgi:hypothetical protein